MYISTNCFGGASTPSLCKSFSLIFASCSFLWQNSTNSLLYFLLNWSTTTFSSGTSACNRKDAHITDETGSSNPSSSSLQEKNKNIYHVDRNLGKAPTTPYATALEGVDKFHSCCWYVFNHGNNIWDALPLELFCSLVFFLRISTFGARKCLAPVQRDGVRSSII